MSCDGEARGRASGGEECWAGSGAGCAGPTKDLFASRQLTVFFTRADQQPGGVGHPVFA